MGPQKVLDAPRYSLGTLGFVWVGVGGDGGMPNTEHIITMQPRAHVHSDGARA
jgi:hypothetical protein